MPRLSKIVQEHLEKACSASLLAVEIYNKPGVSFRTRSYIVMMVIAWTALLHAIFYRSGTKPWYIKSGTGRGTRYKKIDGEYEHWDLAKCIKQFFEDKNPAERKNIEFINGLRHKIEHRNFPELDPALYGECQAMLMNFEELLVKEFGDGYALAENLAVSLQFSRVRQDEQRDALKALAASETSTVMEYITKFRGGLPPTILAGTEAPIV